MSGGCRGICGFEGLSEEGRNSAMNSVLVTAFAVDGGFNGDGEEFSPSSVMLVPEADGLETRREELGLSSRDLDAEDSGLPRVKELVLLSPLLSQL